MSQNFRLYDDLTGHGEPTFYGPITAEPEEYYVLALKIIMSQNALSHTSTVRRVVVNSPEAEAASRSGMLDGTSRKSCFSTSRTAGLDPVARDVSSGICFLISRERALVFDHHAYMDGKPGALQPTWPTFTIEANRSWPHREETRGHARCTLLARTPGNSAPREVKQRLRLEPQVPGILSRLFGQRVHMRWSYDSSSIQGLGHDAAWAGDTRSTKSVRSPPASKTFC